MNDVDRVPIAREGVWTTDGRLIEPGAIEWMPVDGPLPLRVMTLSGAITIGSVTDIRREVRPVGGAPAGALTAVLSHPIVGLGPGVDLTEDEDGWTREGDDNHPTLRVHHARLRAVTLSPNPVWPDLLITDAGSF